MHIPTHILSGWCVANLLPLGPRERVFCMVAAAIPDLDGAGYIAGAHFYERYHHVLGHNLTFAVISALALTAIRSGIEHWTQGKPEDADDTPLPYVERAAALVNSIFTK